MAQLTIIRGDTVTISTTFTDADGAPVDLTNCEVFFTMKKKKTQEDDDAVLAVDTENVPNPTLGVVVIELSSLDTDIAPGKYYYDFQVKFADNTVSSTVPLICEVVQDVTIRD